MYKNIIRVNKKKLSESTKFILIYEKFLKSHDGHYTGLEWCQINIINQGTDLEGATNKNVTFKRSAFWLDAFKKIPHSDWWRLLESGPAIKSLQFLRKYIWLFSLWFSWKVNRRHTKLRWYKINKQFQVDKCAESSFICEKGQKNLKYQQMPVSEQSRSHSACPEGWSAFGQSCFLFSTDKLVKPEAKRHCYNLDSQLALSSNEVENEYLRTHMVRSISCNMIIWPLWALGRRFKTI